MTKSRSIALIIFSLVLLGIFEGLWLKRIWLEQYEKLQQETNYLFQQSVTALQDSMLRQSMRSLDIQLDQPALKKRRFQFQATTDNPFPADSLSRAFGLEHSTKILLRIDSTKTSSWLAADSLTADQQLQVYVVQTGSNDSTAFAGLDRVLTELPGQIRLPESGRQVFKLEKNMIPIDRLEKTYRKNLLAAGIPLDFAIVYKDEPPFGNPSGGIVTKPVLAGLLVHQYYAAHFTDYQAYLLRQILPALAFALLLFGVTAAAFLLIYRSMRHQQRLTRLKNEFISNITHELKTPITTVGVALEALSSFDIRNNPEKSREYLQHSKQELDRLSLLVEKVLRLSMFDEQETRLKTELFDLALVVHQVVAAMRLQAERAGAHVQVLIPETVSFQFNGDKLHLSSVIFNLLDNALKYTSQHPDIHIALEKIDSQIRLTVRDNGTGIPEALQEKVFDKFFRIQEGNRHDVKGHGLGLSYAAMVVRQHQGRIWVESNPGGGAAFFVQFPAREIQDVG
ncbi:MAG: HAMP domain-containing sensor histidine kinase [Saprospiraceae bacterium]